MKGKELLLVVLVGLIVSAVAVYVSGPAEQPCPTEPLVFSLENCNCTIIRVNDTEWARGTLFDWDPTYTYTFDFWIIAELG